MQLENLKTNYLGKEFIYYKEIDSTQDEIWRRIKNNNIKNGTIIMADIQTKGKGTHGRIWHTDETENIAFSLYIKTDCNIKNVEILVRIFKQKYNIQLDIKKPNDIMFNNKKLGGILTESKVNADKVKLLVIGIGINTEKANFTKDIENIATSIKKEFGINVDRMKIISSFCNEFEKLLVINKI